ncbi:MAG: hypothetical protein EZS28_053096, partial [Streblomastix strix]
MLSPAYTLK